ncbi:MAG: patatin-like phospholipase family protein [Treponema sp.]|nr:patatin-like phospholipase family protein [Treponema sp.]
MCRKSFWPIIAFATLLVFSGCKSTSSTSSFTDVVLEPEELAQLDDYSFAQEYYNDVTWKNLNHLDELTGIWVTPKGTLEFPYMLDGIEYLSITQEEKDDTLKWEEFAKEKMLSFEEVWENRFIYLSEIYGTDYPLSDENGTQLGIKLKLENYGTLEKRIVTSSQQLLITSDLVSRNLAFFKLSEDGTKINTEGIFRFFSRSFMNMSGEQLFPDSTRLNSFNKFGLVLSGGGGKGAYEVGVWKALLEYGLAQKMRAVSGTSVGGLNSALFAIVPYDQIETIWLSKVPGKLTQNDALISQEGLEEILSSIPLVKLQNISFPQVYVTAVRNKFIIAKLIKSKVGQYAVRFNLNDEVSISQAKKKLLATSAFPILCPPVKLSDGFEYSDGGNEGAGGDNTPIDPIINNHSDIDKIFVVYLTHEPKRLVKEIDYDTKHLVQIIPSIELGGILDGTANFTSSRITLLIKYGYEDTVKILKQNGYYPVSQMWFMADTQD